MDGQNDVQNSEEVADDGATTAQGEKKPQQQQQQRGGRKGKKKTKYVALDLSSIPDTLPSAPPREAGGQQPRQWQKLNDQASQGAWGGDGGSGGSQGTSSSWSGNRGGGSNWGRRDQGYGSGQRYNQSYNDGPRDRGSNIALSKALVTLLRHGKPRDIKVDGGGYAFIDEILEHYQFKKFNSSVKAVLEIIKKDTKDRFEVEDVEGGRHRIRATQGHSVKLEAQALGLTPLTDPKKYPTIVHGTYKESWRFIKKTGLNRMTRTHVHFAIGHIGETHVTSGMRITCDIIIELDLEKALQDGLKFFESANRVVLCQGDEQGNVSPKYFKTVKRWSDAKGFEDINFQFEEA